MSVFWVGMGFNGGLYLVIAGWGAMSPVWLQWLALVATQAVLVAFVLIAGFVWWQVDRRARALLAMLLGGAAGWFGADLVKDFFQGPRPCRVHLVETIDDCTDVSFWSFPSGHATTAGAFAVVIALFWRRGAWLLAVLALLEAFLRVFLGVHYPLDVLAGLVFGAVIGLLAGVAGRPGSRRPPAGRAGDAATATSAGQ